MLFEKTNQTWMLQSDGKPRPYIVSKVFAGNYCAQATRIFACGDERFVLDFEERSRAHLGQAAVELLAHLEIRVFEPIPDYFV